MFVRSKAPLRISFCGGGTDVSPYSEERGGLVLSATIDKYAYATLRPKSERDITVHSLDYNFVTKYNLEEPLPYDGSLDLVKAAINRLNTGENSEGMDFFLHSDAPPGSGLGASSTLVVALIGLFKHRFHLPLTNYEIAELAFQIERVDMAIHGGKQDQYAATFGGFNLIEFSEGTAIVTPLRMPADVLNELHYNMLLCFTGKTRISSGIIETQVDNYMRRQDEVLQAMEELKAITERMKRALLQGHLTEFGGLLHDAWENKKRMAQQISPPFVDELYQTARNTGALGGKISGAGGGGYMFFYCDFERKHLVAEALEKMGARVVEFDFDFHGLQTWEVRP